MGTPIVSSGSTATVITAGARFDQEYTGDIRGLRARAIQGRRQASHGLGRSAARIGNTAVASTADGAAVVAWFEMTATQRTTRLRIAVRDGAGHWTPPRTLLRGPGSASVTPNVDAFISPDDRWVIAADDLAGRALMVWSGQAARVGARKRLAQLVPSNRLRTVLTSTGSIVVAWASQEADGTRWVVRATTADRADRELQTPQTLTQTSSGMPPAAGFELAPGPADGALLAFVEPMRSPSASIWSLEVETGEFRRLQRLTGDYELGGLAVRAAGAAVLTAYRTEHLQPHSRTLAWFKPAARGRFGAETRVPIPQQTNGLFVEAGTVAPPLPGEDTLSRTAPIPTFDPRSGDAVLAAMTSGARGDQLVLLRHVVQ